MFDLRSGSLFAAAFAATLHRLPAPSEGDRSVQPWLMQANRARSSKGNGRNVRYGRGNRAFSFVIEIRRAGKLVTSQAALESGQMLCAFLVSVVTLSAQGLPRIEKKSLEAHIQEVTGAPKESVVNCGEYGIVEFGAQTAYNLANLQSSLACARDAAEHNKRFRIVVHGMTEDSRTAYGVLGNMTNGWSPTPKGTFWFFYDSAPCGGPSCAEKFEISPWSIQDIVVFINEQGQYEFGRLKR